jgi:hypothetical protein
MARPGEVRLDSIAAEIGKILEYDHSDDEAGLEDLGFGSS